MSFSSIGGISTTFTPGSLTYGKVSFEGLDSLYTFSGTMTVSGDLLFADTGASPGGRVNTGTIDAQGNVTASNKGNIGTSTVRLTGNAAGQTISSSTVNSYFPHLVIVAGANAVTFGTSVVVGRGYTMTSVGTFNVAGSTLYFKTLSSGVPNNIAPGAVAYGNVTIDGYDAGYNFGGGTMTINGTFTLGDAGTFPGLRYLNSATFVANGDVVGIYNGFNGNAAVTFAGGSNATLTMAAAAKLPTGVVTVNKPAATLTLGQATSFTQTNQDLTIAAGTLDMAGYNLSVARNISNSGTLKRGNSPTCGTVSQSGSYTGNAAVCP